MYKGLIDRWYIEDFPAEAIIEPNEEGCYVIRGIIFGHPSFDYGVWFRTSQVMTPKALCVEGAMIKTLNSEYKLGSKKKEVEE